MTQLVKMNNFSHIKDDLLRSFNRVMALSVLTQDGITDESTDYYNQFSEQDQARMQMVYNVLQMYGYKEGRALVLANVQYEEDLDDDAFQQFTKEMEDALDLADEDIDVEFVSNEQ